MDKAGIMGLLVFIGFFILPFIGIKLQCMEHDSTIYNFLKTGECPKCGAKDDNTIRLSVSNQSYHDSVLDYCVELKCNCFKNRKSTHVYYKDRESDGGLYNLCVDYRLNKLPWQNRNRINGDRIREADRLRLAEEYRIARTQALHDRE